MPKPTHFLTLANRDTSIILTNY